MNLIEEIKNDEQILRVLYNSLQQVANEIEKKNYWDVDIQTNLDFYEAVRIATDMLIEHNA